MAAANLAQWDTTESTFKFFNTFLRSSLKERSIQAFCSVLFEYRLVGLHLIALGEGELAVQIVSHMKQYSDAAQVLKIRQASEMVAYDVSVLLQYAAEEQLGPRHQHQMLQLFLLLDKVPEDKDEEIILRGIRKAQMKLAAYYLYSCNIDTSRYAL